jgi:SAM-dependent methyltransferase
LSTWDRGVSRVYNLLKRNVSLQKTGLSMLDAGCGDGMTGLAFASYGYKVELIDFEDWRDPRAKSIPFKNSSLSHELPYDSNSFDLVCSFNTFEHLERPKNSFEELLRVCKHGGIIYLAFGPLYNSPWGLHVYRTLYMPYPQFLFSKNFLEKKLKVLGILDLGRKRNSIQPLNKWKDSDFMELWKSSKVTVLNMSALSDFSHLAFILKYNKAFSGRKLTLKNVTTQALYATLMKK